MRRHARPQLTISTPTTHHHLLIQQLATIRPPSLEDFCKYLPRYNQICANQSDNANDFIFKSSLNASCKKVKEFASKMTFNHVLLLDDSVTPPTVKEHLRGMLDPRASMALMCMSCLEKANQMSNDTFSICLKHKL
jgi:hypothetical protein